MPEPPKAEPGAKMPTTARAVTLLTPTNQAIYEAGKAMLVDSVGIGRDFCKFMIGTSMGAIPIYLALVKFVLPEKYVPTVLVGLAALIPAVLFLTAGVVFLIGYFPQAALASLDIPDEIERERRATIRRRHRLSIAGFAVFCAAVLVGVIITVWLLRIPQRSKEEEPDTRMAQQSALSGSGEASLRGRRSLNGRETPSAAPHPHERAVSPVPITQEKGHGTKSSERCAGRLRRSVAGLPVLRRWDAGVAYVGRLLCSRAWSTGPCPASGDPLN